MSLLIKPKLESKEAYNQIKIIFKPLDFDLIFFYNFFPFNKIGNINMKKIYIITLFLLSGSVLAHSPLNNDFESMMKRMFNQMQMMDMHHNHLFEEMGLRHNNNSWLSLNQTENKDNFQLKIILDGMSKEDLKIHIDKSLLVIKAEKQTISETGQSSQSFMQQFMIPKNVDKSKIVADYEEGELVVTMPKKVTNEPEVKQITIN